MEKVNAQRYLATRVSTLHSRVRAEIASKIEEEEYEALLDIQAYISQLEANNKRLVSEISAEKDDDGEWKNRYKRLLKKLQKIMVTS